MYDQMQLARLVGTRYNGRCLQHKAVAECRTGIVTKLLEHAADPDVRDIWNTCPLQEALKLSDIASAKALCSRGARISADADTVHMLVDAADSDEAKLHVMVTAAEISINARDHDMRTALHIAAAARCWKAVQNLIAMGADVNARDRCVRLCAIPGLSPWTSNECAATFSSTMESIGCRSCGSQCILYALPSAAHMQRFQVIAMCRWDGTPAEQAVRCNDPVLLRMIQASGGKLSADFQMRTLLKAALTGSVDDISLLAACRADFSLRNYDKVLSQTSACAGCSIPMSVLAHGMPWAWLDCTSAAPNCFVKPLCCQLLSAPLVESHVSAQRYCHR